MRNNGGVYAVDEKVYTIKDAAQKINYSERQLRQLCIDGKVPGACKIPDGRKWLIPENAIEALKKNQGAQSVAKAQQDALIAAVIKQEPYKETPHKQKMREVARSLQSEVGLPYVLEIFLPPGRSTVTLSIDQEGNHLYQGLHSHLETGGFSDVLEEIREWKHGAGLYLAKCHDLFKNVRGEIASDEVIVPPDGQPESGLIIDDFCGTLCADVVGKVTGYPTHLGYKTERHFLRPHLWVLRYGAYGIYLSLTKEDLEKHQNMHKDLIGKYVSDAATREMATQREKLSEIGIQISRQLLKFSDMERLPGHCGLC